MPYETNVNVDKMGTMRVNKIFNLIEWFLYVSQVMCNIIFVTQLSDGWKYIVESIN